MLIEKSFIIKSLYPLTLICLPLLLVMIIYLLRNRANIRDFFVVLVGGILTLLSFEIYKSSNLNFVYITDLFYLIKNVKLSFLVDSAGVLFFMVISLLWLLTSVYSIGYMRSLKEHSQSRFYAFFALAIFASIGVCFSKNLLTLFIFYEILSISTYPLVTHHKDSSAIIAGRKYLGFILGGSIGLVLPAMIYIYLKTGALSFTPGGILIGNNFSSFEIFVLLAMFLFGFAKASVIPMHVWLPNAMVAPTPVSALLHAVAVVKVGVFSLYRVVSFIFGKGLLLNQEILGCSINTIFCLIVSFTILIGALIAIGQDNLKRRLAFSTISQLSYIVLGIFILQPIATAGALFYLVIHAFAKITLFYIVGLILIVSGKKCLSEIRGLGYKMPIPFICFFIASLSLVGIPPSGGFLAKYMLLEGVLWGNRLLFIIVYITSSLLAALYLFPVIFEAFKKEENLDSSRIEKLPVLCMIPIIITTLISVLMFFYSDFCTDIIFRAVYQTSMSFF